MTHRLASAYGGAWPNERIPVDVVTYAHPVGAYTTAGRITVSSTRAGYEMPHALEMVFHEVSHMPSLESAVRSGIDDAFKAAGGEAPPRLWHDFIFWTSGELARVALEEIGIAAYHHYGDATGLYSRNRKVWERLDPVLRRTWQPVLASHVADSDRRRAALLTVAKELK